MMWQGSGGYLQNFKSIHTKLKEICACTVAHLVIEIQAMIYDAARVRRLCTKFQVNTSKNKNLHFFFWGGSFFFGGGALGERRLDCGQYQILTDPRNGLKNPNMNFGNDRSHRLGGV